MKRMLFNATHPEETRVGIVDGQKLIDIDIETLGREARKSNIYKGVVTRIEPSLEACFINYGEERHGFLSFKQIARSYFKDGVDARRATIAEAIHVGQEMVVQVEKEERGNKGAALTTFISLAGRYLVLMPNNSRGGGVSRRVEGTDREALRDAMRDLRIPQGMSTIARTAAIGRSTEELQWDLDYLLKLWEAIDEASQPCYEVITEENGVRNVSTTSEPMMNGRHLKRLNPAPYLIVEESNLVVRAIRDYFQPEINEILVDTPAIYEQIRQFMAHVMPDMIDRVKLYRDDIPLFTRFQIEQQIETAYSRTVPLPSGGAIVIDHTEALVAVDVNSARATRGSDIEETAFRTNCEAADEVARQMRLRDLGGLIVIDFIDMMDLKNQRAVEQRFRDAIRYDRARVQTGKISNFGLMEVSRQRLRPSLSEGTHITCPRCNGIGVIRDTETCALQVLRVLQEEALKDGTGAVQAQVPVDVATYLLNEKRNDITKIESRHRVPVILIPNTYLETPKYFVERIRQDDNRLEQQIRSFDLVQEEIETKSDDPYAQKSAEEKKSDRPKQEPVVKNIPSRDPVPVPTERPAQDKRSDKTAKAAPKKGLLARFFSWLVGASDDAPKADDKATTKKRDARNKNGRTQGETKARNGRNKNGAKNRNEGANGKDRPAKDDRKRKERVTDGEEKDVAFNTRKERTRHADKAERNNANERGNGRRRGERNARGKENTTENLPSIDAMTPAVAPVAAAPVAQPVVADVAEMVATTHLTQERAAPAALTVESKPLDQVPPSVLEQSEEAKASQEEHQNEVLTPTEEHDTKSRANKGRRPRRRRTLEEGSVATEETNVTVEAGDQSHLQEGYISSYETVVESVSKQVTGGEDLEVDNSAENSSRSVTSNGVNDTMEVTEEGESDNRRRRPRRRRRVKGLDASEVPTNAQDVKTVDAQHLPQGVVFETNAAMVERTASTRVKADVATEAVGSSVDHAAATTVVAHDEATHDELDAQTQREVARMAQVMMAEEPASSVVVPQSMHTTGVSKAVCGAFFGQEAHMDVQTTHETQVADQATPAATSTEEAAAPQKPVATPAATAEAPAKRANAKARTEQTQKAAVKAAVEQTMQTMFAQAQVHDATLAATRGANLMQTVQLAVMQMSQDGVGNVEKTSERADASQVPVEDAAKVASPTTAVASTTTHSIRDNLEHNLAQAGLIQVHTHESHPRVMGYEAVRYPGRVVKSSAAVSLDEPLIQVATRAELVHPVDFQPVVYPGRPKLVSQAVHEATLIQVHTNVSH